MNNSKIKKLLLPIIESILMEEEPKPPTPVNIMYSFEARFNDRARAIDYAKIYTAKYGKKCKIVKVKERGNEYFDVRTEN